MPRDYGITTITFEIRGTRPLLMHSARLADPLDAISRQIKAIKKDRRRTEADEELAALLEWEAGLYYSDELGPYIPSENLESMLKESARKWRKGKDIERGVMVPVDAAIQYDGPRALAELKELPQFRDTRSARMPSTGSRVVRCRPRFPEWSLTFSVQFDPRIIEEQDLREIVERAGEEIGLGDWRPRYGAFEIRDDQ